MYSQKPETNVDTEATQKNKNIKRELTKFEQNIEKTIKQEQEYLKELEMFYNDLIKIPKKPDSQYQIFTRPNQFYKQVLNLSKEYSVGLNKYINILLTTQSDSRKTQYARTRITSVFWDFCIDALKDFSNIHDTSLIFFLRYGMLVTSVVPPPMLTIINNIDITHQPNISIFYIDEWIRAITEGLISQTLQDEVKKTSEETRESVLSIIHQLKKQIEAQTRHAITIDSELSTFIADFSSQSDIILNSREPTEDGYSLPYTQNNIEKTKNIYQTIRSVLAKSKELKITHDIIQKNREQIENHESKIEQAINSGSKIISNRMVSDELNIIRKMCKMTAGRRGNTFPLLINTFFTTTDNIGYRERVIQILHQIETTDHTIFKRTIRGQDIRIFPNIVLVPSYGASGFCWEPFERYKKNTSLGRIIIPMYPKDLQIAILHALGDFRWQLAKQISGPLWMEEGITGWYFQWFNSNIKKGDIKKRFIMDYIYWIKWEQTGVQKLNKEVREIFWRFIPFNQKTKKALIRISTIYQALYKKEQNRLMSKFL